MLIRLIQYIKGYVQIRVEGYSPERFLNLCSHHNIFLWGIQNKGNGYEMFLSVKGFRKLKPIMKKTKTRLHVLDKKGLPFFLHKYRKRKTFFFGILFCITTIYVMSLFVWNIHIDGNYTRTTDVILDFLAEDGVYHGILKHKLDCQKIEADIRKEFDDIIWASAEIRGTRLLLKVKENTDMTVTKGETKDAEPTDIVANKDGIIEDIITRNGVPAVKKGDVVAKGDLLVSGRIEVLNDAAEVASYQYCTADTDIYAKTLEYYEDSFPLTYTKESYTGKEQSSLYVSLFGKRLVFGFPHKSFEHFDTSTSENQLKIGESFYLPVHFGTILKKEYLPKEKTYTEKESMQIAKNRLSEFMKGLEKKGVQILENDVKIQRENNTCVAKGKLQVIEKIGMRVPTEILEVPKAEEGTENNQ